MGSFDHVSVLLDEVLAHLAPRPGGIYCDGTLGGAGHSRAIVARAAPGGQLIGIDRDRRALAAAQAALDAVPEVASGAARVTLVHGTFGEITAHLEALGIAAVDGFVLDLGVSSPQLDQAERGFSFTKAGPIDMRMDDSAGPTALELIRELSPEELTDVLRDFGEERHAKRIARLLKEAAAAGELSTTIDLATVAAGGIPARERATSKIHPATRTFQALRIAVNRELDELTRFLVDFPRLLAPGGRCVVISFHSLEDRLVKHAFRDLAWSSSLPERYAREAGERVAPVCVPVTKKVVEATEDEIRRNPRARSAKLRACARTAAPYEQAHR